MSVFTGSTRKHHHQGVPLLPHYSALSGAQGKLRWSLGFLPPQVVPQSSCQLVSYQCMWCLHRLPRIQARSGTDRQVPTTHHPGCSAYGVRPRARGWPAHGASRSLTLPPSRQVLGECQGIGLSCTQPQDSAGRTHVQTPGPHRLLGCGRQDRGHAESGGPGSSAPHSASWSQMQGHGW